MSRIDEILAIQSTLPAWLQRSRETIEADEQAQELRRASFGRGRLTEEERTVSHGMTLESIALSNLPLARNAEDLERERLRLAQGLELQGRFVEASKVHPHQAEKDRLLAIENAVDMDDGAVCDCAPTTATKIGSEDVAVQPHYEVKKIYSRKHKRMVSLVGCTGCDELNATPTPPEQLQRILHAHRGAAIVGKPTEHEHAVLK